MISLIQPLSVGNALRIFLDAPPDATRCRLLRNASGTFTGQDDHSAVLVMDDLARSVVDIQKLSNGTPYYYCPFYLIGGTWEAGDVASAVPAATYQDFSCYPQAIVRDRLDAGLQVEVQRGHLKHHTGRIPVLTAPPLFEDKRFPVVTVHLQSTAPANRGIGEMNVTDEFDDLTGRWSEQEGWFDNVQLTIVGWCMNPDERMELHKALRRLVTANLSVFDFAGMSQIEFSQQDIEDFESFNAPMYQTFGTFSCLARMQVGAGADAITDVEVSILE